jgi:hypothetical protein
MNMPGAQPNGLHPIEFDHDHVIARSRKQSRRTVETSRRIDLHPEGTISRRICQRGQFFPQLLRAQLE